MDMEFRYPTLPPLIAAFKEAPQILKEEMRVGLTKATLIVEREAKKLVVKDTGTLRRSITSTVEVRGTDLVGVVGTNQPHAKAIEYSRLPGEKYPPAGVLVDWMRRHGIALGGVRADGTTIPPKLGKSGYYQVEFLIARKIGKLGTKAQPYLIPAFTNNRQRITEELGAKTAGRVIKRLRAGAGT